ncbi:MAG: hypothetical protein WCD89_04595 [Anaerocolumna sp.]
MISKFIKIRWTSNLLTVILIMTVAAVDLTGCKKSSDVIADNVTDISDTASTTEDGLTPADTTTPDTDTTEVNPNGQSNSNSDQDQNNDNTADAEQGQSPSSDQSAVYYGDWVISKVLAYGSVGTYSKEDAEGLVGKELSFTAGKAASFGDDPSYIDMVALEPVYSETVLTSSDFVLNYRMTFEKLGIEADSIPEVSVTDADGSVCGFLVKDENTLILTFVSLIFINHSGMK